MSLIGAVGSAVSGTPSSVSIGVFRLSSVLVGRGFVSGVRFTMEFVIEPSVPGGFGFGGLRNYLFVVTWR